jgi:sulfonate transport system permease protein
MSQVDRQATSIEDLEMSFQSEMEQTSAHAPHITIPRITKRKWTGAIRGAYLPIAVLVIWQGICTLGWVPATLLPSPAGIVQAFMELVSSGELLRDVGVSLTRACFGFLLGGTSGLLMGLATGLSKQLDEFIDPTIQMGRTIPHLAITPLFILWFGLGEWSKVLLIALGAFFPLYVNTFTGIRNVDAKLFDVARVLEFNRLHQITKLVIPAALPNILLGLRLSIGVSWLGLVVAELMGASSGVGYLIENASQFSQTAVVFVGIILFAVVGKLSDSFVRLLERRLLRWRDSYSG